jgi:hypothetical protein
MNQNVMNLSQSNQEIINLINSNKPFSIIRFGWGPETILCHRYYINNNIKNVNNLNNILRICGIYSKNNDISIFEKYFEELNKSVSTSDLLVSFENSDIDNIQNYYSEMYELKQLNFDSLESYKLLQINEIPWSHYLLGKKVLIINPFTDSIKKQLNNNFQLFKDKKIFLDDQEFIFYKTFQTHGNNYIHENWLETFNIMCNDIEKLNFDIALLGCGGYGIPLCNFIKTKMNKSAIYVGGALQILFGVMGNRWINGNGPVLKKILEEHKPNFIHPSGDELLPNRKNVENGCYW